MENTESGDTINRRTVLKGIGAASTVAFVGVPGFAGTAVASNGGVDPDDFRFYAVTPSSNVFGDLDEDVTQYLITIDPSDASAEVVTELTFEEQDNLQTPSLAFHPDGTLYGIDINPGADGQVYTIDPSTGDVSPVGSKHTNLRRMFGTAFTSDGTYHGLNTEVDALFSPIDYTESGGATDAPTEVGDLVDQNGDPIDAIHTGLANNTATDTIYSTLGNQEGGSKDEVGIVDLDTGVVDIVREDVFSVDVLVGAEFNPCTGELFAIRNGSTLLSIDLATNQETTVGTVTIDGEEIVADNLASMWVACDAGCTRTIGYYKTHSCDPRGNNDDVVAPLLGDDGIWLGSPEGENSVHVTDSCQAQEILDLKGRGPGGNLLEQLKAQLLAAKLNVRAGADQSEILETILAADAWLADDGSIDDEDEKDMVEGWKDALDEYNNGVIGPGSCDEEEEEEEE